MPTDSSLTTQTDPHEDPMPTDDASTDSIPSPETPMPEDDPMADTLRTPATFARVQLAELAQHLGYDEVRVLHRIADRLALGATRYGRLQIATDARSLSSKEAREEVEDALVYLACAWLKAEEVAA